MYIEKKITIPVTVEFEPLRPTIADEAHQLDYKEGEAISMFIDITDLSEGHATSDRFAFTFQEMCEHFVGYYMAPNGLLDDGGEEVVKNLRNQLKQANKYLKKVQRENKIGKLVDTTKPTKSAAYEHPMEW